MAHPLDPVANVRREAATEEKWHRTGRLRARRPLKKLEREQQWLGDDHIDYNEKLHGQPIVLSI